MEIYRPGAGLFEPVMYRISIFGNLDKNWSDYCGGMTIEHVCDPKRYPMTMLTGRLADQSALIGVLNSLHDIGCPILSVECVEEGQQFEIIQTNLSKEQEDQLRAHFGE